MEMPVLHFVFCVLAAWMWAWLSRACDHSLGIAIFLQQRLGVLTPRPLYWLADRGRWLFAGGAAIAVAGHLSGFGAIALVVLLGIAVGLLTCIHAGMGRLLHPGLVGDAVRQLDHGGDEPEAPVPAA
jgi:hypothetical protein